MFCVISHHFLYQPIFSLYQPLCFSQSLPSPVSNLNHSRCSSFCLDSLPLSSVSLPFLWVRVLCFPQLLCSVSSCSPVLTCFVATSAFILIFVKLIQFSLFYLCVPHVCLHLSSTLCRACQDTQTILNPADRSLSLSSWLGR